MTWLVAEKLREIVEGILDARVALRGAQEAVPAGVWPVLYAYVEAEVDALTRTLVVKTGNSFFAGDRDEVMRGRIGGWALIWERHDIGTTTGEDYMPGNLRTWLLEHTRAEDGGEHYEYGGEHYWDIYPW